MSGVQSAISGARAPYIHLALAELGLDVPRHEARAATANPDFNLFLSLLLLVAGMAYNDRVPVAEQRQRFIKLSANAKSLSKWIDPKVWRIFSDNTVSKGKMSRTQIDAYMDGIDTIYENMQDLRDKIKKDPSISHDQLKLWNNLRAFFYETEQYNLKKHLDNAGRNVPVLSDPELLRWFTPQAEAQEPLIKELKFIVQKLGGSGIRVDPDVLEKAASSRVARYKELHKKLGESNRAHVRDIVRESGKAILPTDKVHKEMRDRGALHWKPPEGFVGHIDETGKLYTKAGKLISKYPQPGSTVTMNPAYDPDKDNGYVFSYIPPGATDPQYAYTADWDAAKRGERYGKVEHLTRGIIAARFKWLSDMKSTSPEKFVLGTILELLYSFGARIGSSTSNQTDGASTYGITTLLVKNVSERSGGVLIRYKGKKGVDIKHFISAKGSINNLLLQSIRRLSHNKDASDFLFTNGAKRVTSGDVNAYIKSKGLNATAKTFRTFKGTETMRELMKNAPLKQKATQKEAEDWFKNLALKVGQILGHVRGDGEATGATAIRSYIDPSLGQDFFRARNLRIPKFLEIAK